MENIKDFTPGCTAANTGEITGIYFINRKWTTKAFHKAIERGDAKAIKRMIDKGRIINVSKEQFKDHNIIA